MALKTREDYLTALRTLRPNIYKFGEQIDDVDGVSRPIVSVDGGYTYVGRLIVTFNKAGDITAVLVAQQVFEQDLERVR